MCLTSGSCCRGSTEVGNSAKVLSVLYEEVNSHGCPACLLRN